MAAEQRTLILSVNSGSSSLKISVFCPKNDVDHLSHTEHRVELLLTATVENITAPPALFSFSATSPSISKHNCKNARIVHSSSSADSSNDAPLTGDVKDHQSAFSYFLKFLQEATAFEQSHIAHVCHRVVHGGRYPKPVLITKDTYHHIERLSDLAPLHNGNALRVINACLDILPSADSIAFFDSSFHSTIPDHVKLYAINYEIAESKALRKYGFHGLSYAFILRVVSTYLNKLPSDTSLIVMHLGSGASVCAIRNGESIDTSMGLTPLDGLPGATRSGSIDPSLIFHYTNDASKISHQATEAVDISDAEEILNKHSGWKALTGTTNFAEITKHYGDPAFPKHTLAFDIFVDRILNFVGSYFLKLGGTQHIDALIFSGGIGERSALLRKAVVDRCRCLGFHIDDGLNEGVDEKEGSVISIGGGAVKTLVCRTDEQLEMARECSSGDYDKEGPEF